LPIRIFHFFTIFESSFVWGRMWWDFRRFFEKEIFSLWRHFEVAPPDCLRHFSRFFDVSKTLQVRYL